jgi:hypothetical protein
MATPSEFAAFTPEQARAIWQIVQKAMAADSMRNTRKITPIDEPSPHRVRFKNDSGEEIPSFACMQVMGTVQENNTTFVLVDKPSDICGEYLFNSPYPVEADGYGWGYAFGQVRMRGTASTFDACTRYAPAADSWEVAEGPGPFIVYGIDDVLDNVVRGRIVGDHCKARWIQFTYTAGGSNATVTPTAFFDGPDPSECGDVTVSYPIGEPLCDTPVMAFYDPNTDEYQAVSTPSALMGEPVTQDLVTAIDGDECGISYQSINFQTFPTSCDPEPATIPVEFGTDVTVVLGASSDECGKINTVSQSMKAILCDSEGEPTEPVFGSFAIDFGDQKFVTAAEFGPPECDGEATYTWNTGTSEWELTSPCSAGCESEPPEDPPVSSGDSPQVVPCSAISGTGCGLNLQLLGIGESCDYGSSGGPTPQTVHVPLYLQPVTVVTEIYDNATDAIVIERAVIYVCNFEAAPDDQIAIADCPEEIPSSGGGCSGNAVYLWDVDTQNWTILTPCPNGCQPEYIPSDPPDDPDAEEQTLDVPCVEGDV